MPFARPRRLSGADVLEEVFALPSDLESDDDLENVSDIEDPADGTVDVVMNDDAQSSSSETLYQLADYVSDSSESETDTTESMSDEEETDWKKTVIHPPTVDFDAVGVIPVCDFLPNDSPIDFFSYFFDDCTYQLIVDETNRYARQNNLRHWSDTSVDEIKAVFGIMIAAGLHKLPDITLYWSTNPLYRVQPIADIMTMKRYKKLLQALHLNDNLKTPTRRSPSFDKLYKVRPLVDHLNDKFQHACIDSSSQSVDEAMIGFKGRSSMKQYMPQKPVKRGYKVWVRADANTGYMYQFEIYTGKTADEAPVVGLGSKVVLTLTSSLAGTYSHVAFDNYFSSVPLLEKLFDDGILATCTIRSNRKELPILARSEPTLKRGELKWRTKKNIGYVQWRDTKVVHVISTAFRPDQVATVRRTQKDGSRQDVSCPLAICQYTQRMGGVDRFDQKRCYFSVSRRSFKWWIRIFYFLVDSALVNAHIMFNSIHPDDKMNQFDFRTTLCRQLMSNFSSRTRKSSIEGASYVRRRSDHGSTHAKSPGVPDDVRLQSVGKHWPHQMKAFRRCRVCSSQTNNRRSRIVCSACNVALCIDPCFEQFHMRK